MEVNHTKYKLISVHSSSPLCTYCYVLLTRLQRIRVFLRGNYEFSFALYCHSGASGMLVEFFFLCGIHMHRPKQREAAIFMVFGDT